MHHKKNQHNNSHHQSCHIYPSAKHHIPQPNHYKTKKGEIHTQRWFDQEGRARQAKRVPALLEIRSVAARVKHIDSDADENLGVGKYVRLPRQNHITWTQRKWKVSVRHFFIPLITDMKPQNKRKTDPDIAGLASYTASSRTNGASSPPKQSASNSQVKS